MDTWQVCIYPFLSLYLSVRIIPADSILILSTLVTFGHRPSSDLHLIETDWYQQSLSTGRPPTFALAYVDCSFPDPHDEEGVEGGGSACECLVNDQLPSLT